MPLTEIIMFPAADSAPWLLWMPYISLLLLMVMYSTLAGDMGLVLLFVFTLLRNWESLVQILQSYNLRLLFWIMGCAATTYSIAAIANWLIKRPINKMGWVGNGPKPLLIPSRTSHTRLFPKSHSFSYSYLLAGVPVGWQGSAGGMLSADQGTCGARRSSQQSNFESSWYTIDAEDYLDRGNGHLGLDGKLRNYLQSQGVRPEDYPYAYLITAPKFLGYSFNPVSFWYLYSADRELTALIAEVNNTFDERHVYLLRPSEVPREAAYSLQENDTTPLDSSMRPSDSVTPGIATPTRFTNSWIKEFHVSPFNSRKGTYSIVAYDPLYPSMSGCGFVNNVITLKSSKAHSKLVARIFSKGVPVDPETMATWKKFSFLISWWWVGLVTYPRIVWEAGKLFFGKKLHVWFKPEPLKNTIGRSANVTEQVLEACFQSYLRRLVESSTSPLVVIYTAAGIRHASQETMTSISAKDNTPDTRILEIKVLTPLFYSRFVHYAHDLEAFFSEFNESATIWLSEPSLLPDLVLKKPRPPHTITSLVNYLYFKAIQSLRQRPAPIESPNTSLRPVRRDFSAERKLDIRKFRLSAMDGFILAERPLAEQRRYRTEVLRLFISDRIGFGSVEVLGAEIFLLKCLAAWVLAGSLFRP